MTYKLYVLKVNPDIFQEKFIPGYAKQFYSLADDEQEKLPFLRRYTTFIIGGL